MRVLRDIASINGEINKCPDPSMANLMASHLQFLADEEDGLLIAIIVEPGDTLAALDAELDNKLIAVTQPCSAQRLLQPKADVRKFGQDVNVMATRVPAIAAGAVAGGVEAPASRGAFGNALSERGRSIGLRCSLQREGDVKQPTCSRAIGENQQLINA